MSQTTQAFSQDTTILLHNFPTLIFLCFIITTIILLLIISKRSFISKSPPLPPGPFAWPIVGNLFQIGTNPHETLATLAKKYGPIFSFRLGPKLVVVGSSPAAAMEILKTKDRVLSARFVPRVAPARCMELQNLSIGWVSECDDNWRNFRNFCRTELFSGKSIASQAWIRDQKMEEMLGFLRKMEGKAVKIREVSFATILNIISNILVSKDLAELDFESMNGWICGLIRQMTDVVSSPNVSDFYHILAPFDLQRLQRRARKLCNMACKMWEKVMEEKKENNNNNNSSTITDDSCPPDFLDALLRNGFSTDQINVLFVELFSAGTETSSSTIEWTMAELTRSPRCMKIVQEELLREIGQDQVVKESDLSKLTYLQACVKEVLRLHPAGPLLLPHRAAESCTVLNYTIPKDTQVLVNLSAIGRDPDVWDEPLAFKPERFLINSGLDFKGTNFEYCPFGSGRKICPGMPLAAKQIPLVVASLIHSFDWSLPKGTMGPSDIDMAEKFGIAMRMKEPLLLVPSAKIKLS